MINYSVSPSGGGPLRHDVSCRVTLRHDVVTSPSRHGRSGDGTNIADLFRIH